MKIKVLAMVLTITMMISISASAKDITNSEFDKYKEKLVEVGHTQEEIIELEKDYYNNNGNIDVKSNNSEMDLLLTEYIDGINKYKNADINIKEVVVKPNQIEKSVSFNTVEPGDIIYEPNRALGFGHTSVVWTDTGYVVEALADEVSSLNSTMEKWNDTTSTQRWCWIPGYSSNTRTSAALNGGKYLNKNYSLLATKLSTNAFYCSLLNWRQYYDVGRDIDKDGGIMVLPGDIYYNDIVQVYLAQG
ncbi:hypothetical protein KPL40_17905 [Clostridium gasigenes]|uniref:hypothetical protein n=1 Tax=Clostridium gasigenes TaxID=94869 RepID=UPI001C0CF548|nr:hypothetical protein [Clostridium gasigenes]MBU3134296.1 hypothetical protein [Clostridium gasigenes]